MKVRAVVGLQWGDEGKGKVVDHYAASADFVVRCQGGANAGHTVWVDGRKMVGHLLPSGAFHPDPICVIGAGVVLDLESLCEEIDALNAVGLEVEKRLRVSRLAHLVLPYHKILDRGRDRLPSMGLPIGTTGRGIGPAYSDKMRRVGLRVGDLDRGESVVRSLLQARLEEMAPVMERQGMEYPDLEATLDLLLSLGNRLQPCFVDTGHLIREAIRTGRRVLFEGAQGTLLDIDHGTYPFVTSSTSSALGLGPGSGVPSRSIEHILGVVKAYATRVGEGPFPTEEKGAHGESLREKGKEFGATTGRPRRCGWLDLPALGYSVALNGIDALALTKIDVLGGQEGLKICVGYEDMSGNEIPFTPESHVLEEVIPIYEEMVGWPEQEVGSSELPEGALRYIERIESFVGVPVVFVGTGPDRNHSVLRHGGL
ncbi:MAG: adenylosuccinate synthase [Planctomycetota bacterium]|nr:adenylosuccinate synthase [Planctomycetota bacterium]